MVFLHKVIDHGKEHLAILAVQEADDAPFRKDLGQGIGGRVLADALEA